MDLFEELKRNERLKEKKFLISLGKKLSRKEMSTILIQLFSETYVNGTQLLRFIIKELISPIFLDLRRWDQLGSDSQEMYKKVFDSILTRLATPELVSLSQKISEIAIAKCSKLSREWERSQINENTNYLESMINSELKKHLLGDLARGELSAIHVISKAVNNSQKLLELLVQWMKLLEEHRGEVYSCRRLYDLPKKDKLPD